MPVEVMYRMYGISREAGAGSGYVQDVRYFAGGRTPVAIMHTDKHPQMNANKRKCRN